MNTDSDEFALLEKYVDGIFMLPHTNFNLEVQDIFEVDHAGEKRLYKLKKLHTITTFHGTDHG